MLKNLILPMKTICMQLLAIMELRHLQVANRLTEKWRKKRDKEQVANISNAVAELKTIAN